MSKKEKKEKKAKKEVILDEFTIENTVYYTHVPDFYKNRVVYKPLNVKIVNAFIPGTIQGILVNIGDVVSKNDKLMTLEAMKMDNVVHSPIDGTIKAILVKQGEMVRKNQILIEFV